VRDAGFWTEVKRRILMWSYVLSAGFYDAYYGKAQTVRAKMQASMNELFDQVDLILWPTSPELARKIWERTNDPLKNYLADIYTIPANIWWYPAMNVPTWFIEKEWETFALWVQLMAPHRREDTLFWVGNIIEKITKRQ
jgi:aspartyl-tRNA(Asn)/glutamyl-tRNA(Gln) amidotransferase subunit A